MSSHPSPPDAAVDELKRRARRRLMGAIVLALAAAVILPMLLESDPKPLGNDVSIQIPPIDSGKFVTPLSLDNAPDNAPAVKPKAETETKVPATPMVPDPAPSRAMAASEQRVLGHPATVVMPSAPEAMRPLAKPETQAPAAPTSAAVSAAPKTAPAPAAVSAAPKTALATQPTAAAAVAAPNAAAGASGTLVVQVAALADTKAAADLVTKLNASGFGARVEPVVTSQGPIQRVRVGTYSSRDAADAALNKIKAAGYATAIVTSK